MANPFLPLWEYIPDGEPRVFGDRVYLYGSHDRAACGAFCDYKLKVWSAPVHDLQNWTCHGISFCTRDSCGRVSEVDWTDNELYAPDVVEKDGKYYLFAYIVGAKGCVGVSDHPEGPFTLLGRYRYDEADAGDDGIYNDAGVLVDDDGRSYIYYGFERSHFNELEPDMVTVKKGSYRADLIPQGMGDDDFFEASSPRKIGGKYYLIYSPRRGSRLFYAVADRPEGPFVRKNAIIDNGIDYPAGNDHGSLACIGGQWYIFYHRMTNGTITSRRACVEKVTILEDGTIPQVEMTSLGFAEALNPYEPTKAEIACVLKGAGYITEKDIFTRIVSGLQHGSVLGYKYYDFGDDFSGTMLTFAAKIIGSGCKAEIHIHLDAEDGEELGVLLTDTHDGVYTVKTRSVTGRHSIFLVMQHAYHNWSERYFRERQLFDLEEFVFMK